MKNPIIVKAIDEENPEDVRRAKIIQELLDWQWGRGGKEEFIEMIKKVIGSNGTA